MKVLVIEDEIAISEVFRKVLEARGHSVVCASDGIEGLNEYLSAVKEYSNVNKNQLSEDSSTHSDDNMIKFKSSSFDLVILNHGLPGLNGTKIAKEILKTVPSQKLFFESATAIEILEQRMMHELGYLLGIMQKPFQKKDIIKIIEEYEALV